MSTITARTFSTGGYRRLAWCWRRLRHHLSGVDTLQAPTITHHARGQPVPITAAELRVTRDWLALSTTDLSDITGRAARAYRASEGGHRPLNPAIAADVDQLDHTADRIADTLNPTGAQVRYRDQDTYLASNPDTADTGPVDYRLHAAAINRVLLRAYLQHADDAFTQVPVRWNTPGRRHDDATVRVLRDLTGVSSDWVAERTGRHPGAIARMEVGDQPADPDVTRLLLDLLADLDAYRTHLIHTHQSGDTNTTVVLPRYRTDEDLAAHGDLAAAGLHSTDHARPRLTAITHGLASLHAAHHLRATGRTVTIEWSDNITAPPAT